MTGKQIRATSSVPAEDPEEVGTVQVAVPGTVIEPEPSERAVRRTAGARVIDTGPERRGTRSHLDERTGLRSVGTSTLIPLVDMQSLADVIVLISADDRAIELRRTARGSAEDCRSPSTGPSPARCHGCTRVMPVA